MNNTKKKWWLAAVVICCLSPAAFAGDRICDKHPELCDRVCDKHPELCSKKSLPEGGSAAIYLLGAGLTCFGAMFLRSMAAKPPQS